MQLAAEEAIAPGELRLKPYQRIILDALSDPATEEVVAETASQIGKTTMINAAVGYYSHWEPSQQLVVQPTVEMGEAWSKERLAPMIRETAALRELYPDPKSRTGGNTIRYKSYPGGFVAIQGANAPAGLAMRPIRVFLGDEVSRWPASAGTEGDPLQIGVKRQKTFWNRKRMFTSSPTVKGACRIDQQLQQTTVERFYCPCPHCGHLQTLRWENVKWETGPDDARLHCEACDAAWSEGQRLRAIDACEVIADHPERGPRRRGFHLSELYSEWSTIPMIVEQFLESKDLPETLQVFVNTVLAELWEAGETLKAEELYNQRRRAYDGIPKWVALVTAGADVQADRIEVEVVGWGPDRESASLGYEVFEGDPRLAAGKRGSPWTRVDELLRRDLGGGRVVSSAMIDAGYLFDEVLAFTKPRARRGVYACRGEAGMGKGWIIATSRNNRLRARVYRLGVDAIKSHAYQYFTLPEGRPGYCWWPDSYGLDYFEQLVAERMVARYVHGHRTLVWELPSGARNEALDCRVYNLAALERVRPRRSAILRSNQGVTKRPTPAGYAADPRWRGFGPDNDYMKRR